MALAFKCLALFLIFANDVEKYDTLETIAAVVGDKIILLSDVEEAYINLITTLPQPPAPETEKEIKSKILNDLITQKLVYLEAEKDTTIKVSEEEVENELNSRVEQLKKILGEKKFKEELEKENLTVEKLKEKYREKVKEQLYVSKYIEKYIKPQIIITPQEVKKFYEEKKDSFPSFPTMVRLSHIMIRIEPSLTIKNATKKKAWNLYNMIIKGEISFEEAAFRYSDDFLTASSGGDLGIIPKNQLPPKIKNKVWKLEPNDISKPMEGELGYHIFKCVDKTENSIHLKHILIKFNPSKSDTLRAYKKAKNIYRRYLKGANFEYLVMTYSQDPQTKALGGDIGWVILDSLPPNIREVVKNMKIGEVKGPVLGQFGYHIIKLLDKKEGKKVSFEDVKEQIYLILQQRKLQEKLEKLREKLEKKYFVDIKIKF